MKKQCMFFFYDAMNQIKRAMMTEINFLFILSPFSILQNRIKFQAIDIINVNS